MSARIQRVEDKNGNAVGETLPLKIERLERENAALREVLGMAKRYVPPQAVTNEWKTKPVSECRLLDAIESVLGKEAQPSQES